MKKYQPNLTYKAQDVHRGAWSSEQNLKYAAFIDIHKKIMVSKRKKRVTKIFQTMAQYVETRSPSQCRSHHQKLVEKQKAIKKIIFKFKVQFGKSIYRQKYREISKIVKQKAQRKIFSQQIGSAEQNKNKPKCRNQYSAIQNYPFLQQNYPYWGYNLPYLYYFEAARWMQASYEPQKMFLRQY